MRQDPRQPRQHRLTKKLCTPSAGKTAAPCFSTRWLQLSCMPWCKSTFWTNWRENCTWAKSDTRNSTMLDNFWLLQSSLPSGELTSSFGKSSLHHIQSLEDEILEHFFYSEFRENYLGQLATLWEGYPHTEMSFVLKFFMLTQLSYWIHWLPEIYFLRMKKDEIPAKVTTAGLYLAFVAFAYLTQ